MEAARERGGVLVRYCEAAWEAASAPGGALPLPAPPVPRLAFIPADVALRITALTALTGVRGMELPASGIALAEGEVVTVLRLGLQREALPAPGPYEPGADWPLSSGPNGAVLCSVAGQRVAVTGATVVATGLFDAAGAGGEGAGVLWRGERVPELDVRALYARAEAAIWAGRAQGSTT
jgi:hypothetical protein